MYFGLRWWAGGLGLGLALGLAGCAGSGPGVERLSATEFTAEAGRVGTMNSAYAVSYIGATPGRVYLERERVAYSGSGTVTTVYWTERAGLPAGVLANLEARGGRTVRAVNPALPDGARQPVGRLRGALDDYLDRAETELGRKLDEVGR